MFLSPPLNVRTLPKSSTWLVRLPDRKERGATTELREMWADIGAKDEEEAERLLRVGDPSSFRLEMINLRRDQVTSPAFDSPCGTLVVMEALSARPTNHWKVWNEGTKAREPGV